MPKRERQKKTLRKKVLVWTLGILFVALVFSAGFVLGSWSKVSVQYRVINRESPIQDLDFSLFWQVWEKIHSDFLLTVNDKKLFYGSIKGLVEGTGDPYSAFLTPRETKMFAENMEEEFYGVGIEITAQNGKIVIVSPLPGTPAEQAGLLSQDEIVAVDGRSTEGRSLLEVVSWIRGQKGTEVVLTIRREGWEAPREFRIKRAKIEIESVRSRWLGKVLYIQVVQFSDKTFPLFWGKAKEGLNEQTAGLIIDLRQNPGGYFQTAVDIASLFVSKGPIVYERNKKGELKAYNPTQKSLLKDVPVVVLVDRASASASEILAGALKDYQKATIIGERTFGKGVIQSWERLADGSSLILTTAYWLTPKKHKIDKQGIVPDIIIRSDKKDCSAEDKVCQKALELLTK